VSSVREFQPARRDATEIFLQVALPAWTASTQAIATGLVDVAAVDVMTAKAAGGGEMWVGASGVKVEVGTIDGVTMRDAEVLVGWDGVQA
jgi:hypothetical protein